MRAGKSGTGSEIGPTTSADFVLDEGLEDEDEEILAFEATRQVPQVEEDVDGIVKEDSAVIDAGDAAANMTAPFPNAVVIDGMPPGANRSQMELFLDGCGALSSLKVARFPDKTIAARIEFVENSSADAAVARSGNLFSSGSNPVIVDYAPPDWTEFTRSHPSQITAQSTGAVGTQQAPSALRGAVMVGAVPVNLGDVLPDAEGVKSAFWDAFASARKAAETLEQRARQAGTDLDRKFHVAEQVEGVANRSRAALNEVDEKYNVRGKFEAAVEAGKGQVAAATEGAKNMDSSYGVSQRVGEATAKVSQAGSVAAREVDENLRISERARAAANAALENEQIGPVVKSTMAQIEGMLDNLSVAGSSSEGTAGSARRKKTREPVGIEQGSEIPIVPLELSTGEDEQDKADELSHSS